MPSRVVVMACALVLSMGVLAAAQSPAYSHDHRPPNVPFLYKGQQELQRARWQEYCWSGIPTPDGFGGFDCALYATTFPVADPLGAGSTLHLRILKVQRPDSFGITAWRNLDANGTPTGRSQSLPSTLRPVRQDGRTVAWDVFFTVNEPGRHYYLLASGNWRDEFDADLRQYASWTLHVRTR